MVKCPGNAKRDFFSEFWAHYVLEIDCWTSIEVARGAVGLSRRSASGSTELAEVSAEPREASCDDAKQILKWVIA